MSLNSTSQEIIAEIIPGNKQVDEWYAALYEALPMYEITTERNAHFLSQCAHESKTLND